MDLDTFTMAQGNMVNDCDHIKVLITKHDFFFTNFNILDVVIRICFI